MVQSQPSPSVDMTPEWQAFIEKKVNSFIKWDLLRFFHDNPHIQDSAENIAGYIGRDTRTIVRELDGLVSVEVLLVDQQHGEKIYRLTTDIATRDLIREFVTACFDRNFRVKAIHHVIHGTGYKTN